jgi:hypothetical protein
MKMKLEHVIRHLLVLCLFCAFLSVMVISTTNLLAQKVGVSIGIKERTIEGPAFTFCPYYTIHTNTSKPMFNFTNLGNGTTFTMPSWINGLWATKNDNESHSM